MIEKEMGHNVLMCESGRESVIEKGMGHNVLMCERVHVSPECVMKWD